MKIIIGCTIFLFFILGGVVGMEGYQAKEVVELRQIVKVQQLFIEEQLKINAKLVEFDTSQLSFNTDQMEINALLLNK